MKNPHDIIVAPHITEKAVALSYGDDKSALLRKKHEVAKAGGAKFFTREKTVENGAAGNALVVLEKDPGLFEYAFFAAGVEIENDVIEGEKVTEVGHKSAKIRCAWESRLYREK